MGLASHKGIQTGTGAATLANKALNMFVKHEHFKMEGLHILPDLIQSEDWMIKLDLKDAYLQVPIHMEHQHLLQFQWEAQSYQFQCLPFGLTSAPWVFSKIMKPVVGALQHMGIRLVIYVPRRPSSYASINGATDTADPIDMPAIRGSGSGGQSQEIHAVPSADPGILGLPSGYSKPTADFSGREAEENTAVSPASPSPIKGVSERSSEVCGKDLNSYTGYMESSSAFQSTTIPNEFSGARGLLPGFRRRIQWQEVQYQSDLDQGGQERP